MKNAHVLKGLQLCQGKEGTSLASLLSVMLEATYGIEITDEAGAAALIFDPAGIVIAADRDLRLYVTDTLAQAVRMIIRSDSSPSSKVSEWQSVGAIEDHAARVLYRRLSEERGRDQERIVALPLRTASAASGGK